MNQQSVSKLPFLQSLLVLWVYFAPSSVAVVNGAKQLSISNGHIRVHTQSHDGHITLVFQTRGADESWRTVLANFAKRKNGPWEKYYFDTLEDVELDWKEAGESKQANGVFTEATLDDTGHTLILSGQVGVHSIQQRITLRDGQHVHVQVRDTIDTTTDVALGALMNHFYFLPDGRGMGYALPLDFAWLPSLHWHERHVSGDFLFRSPAAIAVSRGLYAAIVPDLDVLAERRELPHALDLRSWEHEGAGAYGLPRLSYGLCPWKIDRHVYTARDEPMRLTTNELVYAFDLFLGVSDNPDPVVTRINAHLWKRYGEKYFADIRPQVLPFEEYGRKYSYHHELFRWATKAQVNGKECWGINNAFRRGANFHAWENDLHMGFGIWHYGNKWQDATIKRIGDGIMRMSLQAPQKKGAFPCVFNFTEGAYEGSLYWTSWPASPFDGYDSQAMGVSAWWRLYWYEHFQDIENRDDILESVIEYARFLTKVQMESGAIPTYFDSDLNPAPQLKVSATTSIGGAVLAKIAKLTGNRKFRDAAVKAAEFMEREILPRRNFQDFEVFYSCSRKPLFWIDPINNILPVNNLAIQWTCDQYLAMHNLTDDQRWLRRGEYVMGILSLFHQIWAPPYYESYLFGGFGVMNTDGEWNDGRQARFVSTYADYYRATGNIEYLQRAVSACRASFAAMDMKENHDNHINQLSMPYLGAGRGFSPESLMHGNPQTHKGEMSGGHTGFNWGPGGGLGASAYLERHFGQVWVDGDAKRVVPIDGATARIVSWENKNVILEIGNALKELKYPYDQSRQLIVRFGKLLPGNYKITVNGNTVDTVSHKELSKGLVVTVE